MDRLENKDNNCTIELDYCLDRIGRSGIILVIFEPELKSRQKWNDNARYLFSSDLMFVDLSDADATEKNLTLLVEEIKR